MKRFLILASLLAGGGEARAAAPAQPQHTHLTVVATAYNATRAQTDAEPHIGAWGDRLDQVRGARVIAVSPDLLQRGLRRGQRVRIHGLTGEFVVLDKMPRRWKNHIDIFMNKDIRAARNWGRRRVKISWVQPPVQK
jgi:3D (Asp-Asp-Asp) domain-containing protein